MVVSPLPMAASVIATSGAASNRYSIEAIRLRMPDASTAVRTLWTSSAATAMSIITRLSITAKMIVPMLLFLFLFFYFCFPEFIDHCFFGKCDTDMMCSTRERM